MNLLFGLLILVAPLYVWRFELAGLPTNFLMVYAAFVLVAGIAYILWQKKFGDYVDTVKKLPKAVLVIVSLFFVASLISLFVNGIDFPKIAQWLVLFVLPIGLAKLLYYFVKSGVVSREYILRYVYIFLFAVGLYAILQYFFLIGLPADYLGNSSEPKRAIGFFVHPNGFALFITPLLAYLLPHIKVRLENFKNEIWAWNSLAVIAWGVGVVGLLLSLSRGGWVGLAVAAGIFVLVSSSKKMILSYAVVGVILLGVIFAIPNFRYRVMLPFQGEKSTVARFSLWETGSKMIKDSPVFGQGINGFNYNWDKFNTDPNLDHYNFPHNFILNAWVDLGLLGLLSWLSIVGLGIWYGFENRAKPYALGLALFLIALLVHGLIDIPYFKNDLAMIFWLMIALSL
jgi:putative inorganic carbon (HCO3(-)) transporter